MFNKKETDILVVGAGPVGLTAAHALSDRNMDYVLIDAGQQTNTHSYALALHPETLELLDSLGIISPILKNALKLRKVSIYDGEHRKATLDYSTLPSKYPFLAVIGQNDLETILESTLKAKSHKPMWNHRARFIEKDKDALKVTVDRLTEGMTGYAVAYIDMEIDKILNYDARYLIGADGYSSTARRCAHIDFEKVAPSTEYAVFEFKTDAELPEEMRLIIRGDKTHSFWPLPDGYCRWSFQVRRGEAPEDSLSKDHLLVQSGTSAYPLLDQKHLELCLTENAPWFRGSIGHMRWRMIVKFEQRQAASFGDGRTWLAGDAAHLAPPAGMLSMNVGMREAVDLVERLSVASEDSQRQAALASYNTERRAEWNGLFNLEELIDTTTGETANWLIGHKDRLTGNIPATGESLKALLAQIQLTQVA